MMNFFKNLKINNIQKSFSRFPLCFIYIFLISGIFFYTIYKDTGIILEYNLFEINFALINTLFISLSFYILGESQNFGKIKQQILQMLAIIFGILFYFYFARYFGEHSIIISIGIFGFLFVTGFFGKIISQKYNQEKYVKYVNTTMDILLYGILIGFISTTLGYIALFSFQNLFDINSFEFFKIFGYWGIFCCFLFAPIFSITKIPKNITNIEEGDFNKINERRLFIIKYIVINFFYIFFIILYLYSIKVLINLSDWPKGIVPYLVAGFSIFGYIAYIASTQYENEEKYIRFFKKILPYVILPQVFMLFYAIGLRINQYDLTVNRYIVLIFGIGVLFLCLYFIISKTKRIIFIPMSLSFFTIFFSIGPWSFTRLPEIRQIGILKQELKEIGILKNGTVEIPKYFKTNNKYKSEEQKRGIKDRIDYICKTSKTNVLGEVFVKEYEELKKNNFENTIKIRNKYGIGNNSNCYRFASIIKNKLGIDIIDHKIKDQENIIERIDFKKGEYPLQTSGYNTVYKVIFSHYNNNYLNERAIKNNSIELERNDTLELGFDFLQKTIETLKKNENYIIFEKEDKKYKIIINEAYIRLYKKNEEENNINKDHYNIEGFLLIGEK